MTKDEAIHPSTRTVRMSGADIHLIEWGAGPPVLFLHGNPDSGIMWEGIAERLATHYRCIAPDLPGFGYSEVPAGFERSLDGLAQFVEQFLDAAAIRRPVDIVAHGFGGPFAFAWAVKHPAAVRRMVAINTLFFSDSPRLGVRQTRAQKCQQDLAKYAPVYAYEFGHRAGPGSRASMARVNGERAMPPSSPTKAPAQKSRRGLFEAAGRNGPSGQIAVVPRGHGERVVSDPLLRFSVRPCYVKARSARTQFAEATRGTIRLKLLKLAGLVRVGARRIKFGLASACPYADEWRVAANRLA
jgi:pimeloyl-ACP methyl ester carboxylesterase